MGLWSHSCLNGKIIKYVISRHTACNLGAGQLQEEGLIVSGGSDDGGGKEEDPIDWGITSLMFVFPALAGALFGTSYCHAYTCKVHFVN